MTPVFRPALAALAVSLALALPTACLASSTGRVPARTFAADGFLHQFFHPKLDLGKRARALTYPVKKAAVNGGKIAVGVAADRYLPSAKGAAVKVLTHGK